MRAEDIEKLVSVGRPDDRTRRLVRRLRDVASRSRGEPRGRPALARRPARRHAAPPHPRDGGCAPAPVAGRHRASPSSAVTRRASRRSSSSTPAGGEPVQATEAPLGCRRVRLGARRHGSRVHRARSRAGSLRLGRGAGCRGRGAAPHHRHPLARQRSRLPRRPAVARCSSSRLPATDAEPFYEPAPAVRPRGRDAAEEAGGAARGDAADEGDTSYSRRGLRRRRDPDRAVDEIESARRDLRSVLVAVRVDGAGDARCSVARRTSRSSDVAVADDGTIALLAERRRRRGHRLHRPGSRALDPRAVGPAPAHRRRDDRPRRGRQPHHARSATTSSCRTARAAACACSASPRTGEVTEVLGGDVEVAGHAAARRPDRRGRRHAGLVRRARRDRGRSRRAP